MDITGAHVEILDLSEDEPMALIPERVLVNGVDVGLLAEGGFSIDPGGRNQPVTVTLRLLPSRITFRGKHA